MSDDSPLGNIREQLDESTKSQEGDDTIPEQEPTVEQEDQDESGPWFPFSESKQRPMYPHEETWEELEDAKFEIESHLRQRDVKDVEGREVDDAILQYAITNPEQIAELVIKAREESD